MADTDPRETAKIYDLAVFRRARDARRGGEDAKPERLTIGSGGAWYHEAAIREDDRTRRT